jgi:adhesin transport system outer membrane protein
VLLAQADVRVSEAEIEKEAAPLYPRLDLEVIGNNNRHNNGREDTTYSATFLLVARYNLYRGGADLARVREFKWRKAEAQEQLRVQERSGGEDVRLSWSARDTQRNAIQTLTDQVEANQNTRDVYAQQFDIGQRSLLDLLGRDQRAVPVQERPDHRELRRDLRQLPHPGLAGPAGAGAGRRLPDGSDPRAKRSSRPRCRAEGSGG